MIDLFKTFNLYVQHIHTQTHTRCNNDRCTHILQTCIFMHTITHIFIITIGLHIHLYFTFSINKSMAILVLASSKLTGCIVHNFA